jgi:hypothetical protein
MKEEVKAAIGFALVILGVLMIIFAFSEHYRSRPGPPPRMGPPRIPRMGPRMGPPRTPRMGPRRYRPVVRPVVRPIYVDSPVYIESPAEVPMTPTVYVDGGYPIDPGCDLIFGEWSSAKSNDVIVIINKVGGNVRITTMEGDRKKTQLYNSIKCDGGVITLTARNGAIETLTLSRTANGGQVLNIRGFTLTKK